MTVKQFASLLVISLIAVPYLLTINSAGQDKTSVAQAPPPMPFQLNPDLPHDVVAPLEGATGLQPYMDSMSWMTFVALNWPASSQENGVPDRTNIIGGYAKTVYINPTANGPTVWETFKDAADIFLPHGAKPTPFSAKTGHSLLDNLQSFTTSPLIDQNGQDVYYEVRLNEIEYDYIVKNGLYKSPLPATISFTPGSNFTDLSGSVHIKAAWKIMGEPGSPQPDDQSRFYTAKALVYKPGIPSARLVTVGLVGFHIVHKTKSRPEWVWSTFEHVDNAPNQPPSGQSIPQPPTPPGQYSFCNANCNSQQCPPNQQPAAGARTPVQVLRVTPIPQSTQQLNAQWQQALRQWNPKTVWQYYQLVSTQWPAEPDNTKIYGGAQPVFLANTTLETYFQGPSPANPTDKNPPHSCLDCHGMFAQQNDFMFQLYNAKPAKAKFIPGFFNLRKPKR